MYLRASSGCAEDFWLKMRGEWVSSLHPLVDNGMLVCAVKKSLFHSHYLLSVCVSLQNSNTFYKSYQILI